MGSRWTGKIPVIWWEEPIKLICVGNIQIQQRFWFEPRRGPFCLQVSCHHSLQHPGGVERNLHVTKVSWSCTGAVLACAYGRCVLPSETRASCQQTPDLCFFDQGLFILFYFSIYSLQLNINPTKQSSRSPPTPKYQTSGEKSIKHRVLIDIARYEIKKKEGGGE